MVAGIALGSLLEWLMGALDPAGGLQAFIENGLILGLFDVVGRIFIASLKLLVVPLVMVSLICGMSSLGASSRWVPSRAAPSASTYSPPAWRSRLA
jgi:Na+/H+-dicarboxylate symporter